MASPRAVLASAVCLALLAAASPTQAAPYLLTRSQQRKIAFRQARAEFRTLLRENEPLRRAHRSQLLGVAGQGARRAITTGLGLGLVGGVLGGLMGGALQMGYFVLEGRADIFTPMLEGAAAIGAGTGMLAGATDNDLFEARTTTAQAAIRQGAVPLATARRWLRAGFIARIERMKK
jgi:hypothetical protein